MSSDQKFPHAMTSKDEDHMVIYLHHHQSRGLAILPAVVDDSKTFFPTGIPVVNILPFHRRQGIPMSSLDNEAPTSASITLTPTPTSPLPSSWILLLPAVSVGNVGQLALDLLLSTLPSTHLGHLRSGACLPFAAPAPAVPEHQSSIVTALELYQLSGTSPPVLVVQQRSPCARGRAAEHARAMLDWATQSGCVEVLLLASANAAGLRDPQLRESLNGGNVLRGFRVAMTIFSLEGERLGAKMSQGRMGVPVLESADGDPRGWSEEVHDAVEVDREGVEGKVPAFLPSGRRGSFVRTALEEAEGRKMPLAALVQFVHEGDNTGDAAVMAAAAALAIGCGTGEGEGEQVKGEVTEVVGELVQGWKVPASWMDNAAPPTGLY